MANAENPYQSPHTPGAAVPVWNPSWRYLPATISAGVGVLSVWILIEGIILEIYNWWTIPGLNNWDSLMIVCAFYGAAITFWFSATWSWYRKRYLLGLGLSTLGMLPVAIVVTRLLL